MRECDFIPAAHHQERRLKRSVRHRVSLLGGLVVVVCLWGAVHQRELSAANGMLLDVRLQEEQVTIHTARKTALEEEWDSLESREKLIHELSNSVQFAVLLSDVSRRLPDTMVLTQVELISPSVSKYQQKEEMILEPQGAPRKESEVKLPASSVTMETPRMTLKGLAKSPRDVIRFAAHLEGSPLVSRVLIQAQEPSLWAGRHAEAFIIACDLMEQETVR